MALLLHLHMLVCTTVFGMVAYPPNDNYICYLGCLHHLLFRMGVVVSQPDSKGWTNWRKSSCQSSSHASQSMFQAVFTCCSSYLGMEWRGGSPKGLVHNLLMQFFTLYSSAIDVFKTCFFDMVAPHNDHSSYVKHVLGSIYLFSTLFGYSVGRGGGASKGSVHNMLVQFLTLNN